MENVDCGYWGKKLSSAGSVIKKVKTTITFTTVHILVHFLSIIFQLIFLALEIHFMSVPCSVLLEHFIIKISKHSKKVDIFCS